MPTSSNELSNNPLNNAEVTEPVRDAASVILVRTAPEGQSGLQAFMLRRAGSTTVMNNAYVFPGGKVDPEDSLPEMLQHYQVPADAARAINEPGLTGSLAGALFAAACRECHEECGVTLTAEHLIPFSRWITPKTPAMMRRRFDTRFFVACLPDGASAVHDGVEADTSEWMSPRAAIDAYCSGRITLAPPQIMTLAVLYHFDDFSALRAHLHGHQVPLIEPFPFKDDDGSRSIAYPGDPVHPVPVAAFPGPSRLVWRGDHFEPPEGPQGYFNGA